MNCQRQRLHHWSISCFHYSWIGTHFGHLNFLSFQFIKALFNMFLLFRTNALINFLKTRHLSKGSLLKLKCMTEFVINNRELTFKLLSNKENMSYYNRLDKEVVDFKEYKGRPAVLCNTKCFHHQNGEDADNDKRCKMHTQHQKQIKYYRTIACLLTYIQHKKKVGDQLIKLLQHTLTSSLHSKNIMAQSHPVTRSL